MYKIRFYKSSSGEQPVKDYIKNLKRRAATSKDARIKYDKISEFLEYLQDSGVSIGMPYVKHLEGDLWELRPVRDRIMFFCWAGEDYVMLHYFQKKTQKTPQREIAIAKKRMN